jgi:preprotein translocase subunit SecD
LSVYNAPKTNIRKGLDLEGGTRVLLQPAEKVSKDTLDTIMASMEQRLNVYGISDVTVRSASDLSGSQFIRVEIAGVTEEEVRSLLETQGKFEAKVGSKTVFLGGNDITYVCRSAECSGLDPYHGCSQYQDGWACSFRFSIAMNPAAAKRQADATKDLKIITKNNEPYLNETLDLYLDDQPVDSLNIGADLKGRAVTDIQISGSGAGKLQQEAANDALQNMKKLQTILVTGSLPVKINIVKIDSISPLLGNEFNKSALIMAVLSSMAVIFIIFIKYREIRITVPIAITLISEIIILLGVASLIGWNIDLAAIAGIIAAIGTGVDDQIIITDETLKGDIARALSWKEKFKRAFFIIMASYFTVLVSMLPLLFAGAGLLKGFAITTIIGISVGVFITRPAYAAVIEIILRHKEEPKAE